jgi:hypothetical protein
MTSYPMPINAPATLAFAITPANGADLAVGTRAIYVGGAGNLTVRMSGDQAAAVFIAVPVGTVLPIAVDRVQATGTTATNLVGLV